MQKEAGMDEQNRELDKKGCNCGNWKRFRLEVFQSSFLFEMIDNASETLFV